MEIIITSMFCFQCEHTAKGKGCTICGVCGKKADTANLQDDVISSHVKIVSTTTPEQDLAEILGT